MESKRKTDRKNRKLKKAEAFVNLVRSNKDPQIELETVNHMENPKTMPSPSGGGEETSPRPLHMNQILAKFVNNNPATDRAEVDALKEAKKILAERKKQMMQSPYICLTPNEMLPFQPSSEDGTQYQLPLYPMDVQQLLLFALQGSFCKFQPRWCKLKRPGRVSSVVVITLDGLGYSDFAKSKEAFPFISQSFESSHLEMVAPEQYGSTVDEEIYSVPMSITQIKRANVKVAARDREQIAAKIKPLNSNGDKFPRPCLLLSSHQMKQEGYPMPVDTENDMYNGFVFTKDQYAEVTDESPLYGLDCEMCVTTTRQNELTRVSVVAENGDTLYDTLVKPYNKITNYVTRYSGITPEMMEDVTVRIEDVQAEIQKILPADAILCGQSLNFDLIALKLFHPYVVDTSVIFNMSGNRRCKAGLKKLSGFFLNRTIQNNPAGHSSVEDAKASLDLVKLKLKKGLEYGDATISGTYFPNIETYFLGEDQGTVENVEKTEFKSQDSLKRCHTDTAGVPTTAKILKTSNDSSNCSLGQRRTMFNQNNSVHVPKSFFKLIDEAGRSGCIIGKESFVSKYETEPIEVSSVTSDKEAYHSAKQALEKKELVWVNFDKFRRAVSDAESTEEYIKEAKLKLDERVRKVVSNAKDNSLVVLMMNGRMDVNGGAFVKVKVPSL